MENLITFIPALFFHALSFKNDRVTAALGLTWVIGRVFFARSYCKDGNIKNNGHLISSYIQTALLSSLLLKCKRSILQMYF